MRKLLGIRHYRFKTPILFILIFSFSGYLNAESNHLPDGIKKALELRVTFPDSALSLLALYSQEYLEKKDTLNTINALREICRIEGQKANYNKAYQVASNALELAKEAKLKEKQLALILVLAQIYSYYNRIETTLELYEDVEKLIYEIAKEKGDEYVLKHKVEYHLLMSEAYIRKGDYNNAQLYLDTSVLYRTELNRDQSFLKLWQGRIYNHTDRYQEALSLFHEIYPSFQNSNGAQITLYKEMGIAYKGISNYEKSKKYFLKSIEDIIKGDKLFDNLPEIHQDLAEIYSKQGDTRKAYESLKKSKELEEKYFGSRSEYNLKFLEIQNEFQNFKKIKTQELQLQKLTELENKNKLRQLEKYLFLITLFLVFLGGYFLLKKIWTKFEKEKQIIEREKELVLEEKVIIEQEKKQVIKEKESVLKNVKVQIEEKNKELVTSSLKLIEKDKMLSEIKDQLVTKKHTIPGGEVEKMVNNITLNKDGNWEEFEARFISVNKDFYEKLSDRFPQLTQGDRKLCALIKLNFSSKEIAHLLNISVNSVHTTRSRLRKKINLKRKENLTEFIASI